MYINPECPSDDNFFLNTSVSSLIQLTRNAIALRSEAPETALGFMHRVYENQSYPRLRPFAAFCALLLAASTPDFDRVTDEAAAEICSWIDEEETRRRNLLGDDAEPEQWLFDLNSYADVRGRKGNWRAAAKQVFQQSNTRPIFDSFLEKLASAHSPRTSPMVM